MAWVSREVLSDIEEQIESLKIKVEQTASASLEAKRVRIYLADRVKEYEREIEYLRNENFRLQQLVIEKNELIKSIRATCKEYNEVKNGPV